MMAARDDQVTSTTHTKQIRAAHRDLKRAIS